MDYRLYTSIYIYGNLWYRYIISMYGLCIWYLCLSCIMSRYYMHTHRYLCIASGVIKHGWLDKNLHWYGDLLATVHHYQPRFTHQVSHELSHIYSVHSIYTHRLSILYVSVYLVYTQICHILYPCQVPNWRCMTSCCLGRVEAVVSCLGEVRTEYWEQPKTVL